MSRENIYSISHDRRLKPWQMRLIVDAAGLVGMAALYCIGTSEPSHDHAAPAAAHGQAVVAGELTGNTHMPHLTLPASQISESVQTALQDVPRGIWDYSVPAYLEGVLATEGVLFVIDRKRKLAERRPLIEMRQMFDEIVQHSFNANE